MAEQKREQWGSKMGFILAAVGSAVGLGNIWRFPYLLYSNGGGAFLVPYFIAIFTTGIPLLLLEYSIGHKMRGSAPLSYFRMNKKWEWLGWWPSITSFVILTYYTMILSWALNYVYLSFNQAWGEDTNNYFFNDFLKLSTGPFDLGSIQWTILFGITVLWLLNWFICFKGVSKGIERINKVLLPLLIIIILIIVVRGVTLPGAAVGLNKLFTPDWNKVLEPGVWMDAYGQVFYSLSIGMGIMITYSSYLPKKSDLNNSALMTAFANSGFEFLTAIGVFAILGFMAVSQGVPVDEVATQSIGLAFVVFPKVFSLMGGLGSVFAALFFSALVFAGITSCVSLTEAFVAAVKDKTNVSRKKVVTIVSVLGYSISVLYSTGAGLYFLDIVDAFINAYGLIVIGLLECIVVGWFFSTKVLRKHTNSVSIYSIGLWWDVLIRYVTPTVLTIMLAVNIYNEIKSPYGNYPKLALLIFGWGVVITIIILSIAASKANDHYTSLESTEEVA
ncbi:sodium-dependent transporter [Haloplasma contractile]|uniref:Transporter n=1 Tax=Haloplasma contractile SSD-17B TaxID=1033810 RepID=F7Q0V1_9MOLU|nr:sodium-dependent transporter [Haloplasma contractile]ERJ11324.1 Na+-dependent transporters of the SNF family ral function prediction only protein [Haloplasma contractile SSD-17B]